MKNFVTVLFGLIIRLSILIFLLLPLYPFEALAEPEEEGGVYFGVVQEEEEEEIDTIDTFAAATPRPTPKPPSRCRKRLDPPVIARCTINQNGGCSATFRPVTCTNPNSDCTRQDNTIGKCTQDQANTCWCIVSGRQIDGTLPQQYNSACSCR